MTHDEFKLLAKGLKAAYPSQNFLPDDYSMRLWYTLLKDVDYTLASAAAYKHMCSSRFPPTIADLREQCSQVTQPKPKSWLDGWGVVQKLIGKYGFYRQREALAELDEFDPLAASVVERLGWRSLCMSESPTVDRANFRQCYEAVQTRERENDKLPPAVSSRLQELTQGFIKKSMMIGEAHE